LSGKSQLAIQQRIEYSYGKMEWQNKDRKIIKKINDLIIDIQRNGLKK